MARGKNYYRSVIEPFFSHSQCHFWSTISVDGFTSQVACTWMIQMTLNEVSQKQKIGHLMGHYMIPHHVSHISSLETAITFEPIIRSNSNLNLICILWYKANVESLKKIHRHLFHSKKYMPPPLPYFKVNICPFPLPHFASIFFAYLWSFRWPNDIVILPRYFSLRLPHLNIPTWPPSDELDKNISERSLFYF